MKWLRSPHEGRLSSRQSQSPMPGRSRNNSASSRGRAKRKLLAIKAIETSTRMFQVGQVLLYRAIQGNDVDFSVTQSTEKELANPQRCNRKSRWPSALWDRQRGAGTAAGIERSGEPESRSKAAAPRCSSAEASAAIKQAVLSATEISGPAGDSRAEALDRAIFQFSGTNQVDRYSIFGGVSTPSLSR